MMQAVVRDWQSQRSFSASSVPEGEDFGCSTGSERGRRGRSSSVRALYSKYEFPPRDQYSSCARHGPPFAIMKRAAQIPKSQNPENTQPRDASH
jgi:hypothetical protein